MLRKLFKGRRHRKACQRIGYLFATELDKRDFRRIVKKSRPTLLEKVDIEMYRAVTPRKKRKR